MGLMEFQALIPMGRTAVKIDFTGGFPSAYGVSPAKYTTDNAALQHAIEQSHQFTSGRIYLDKADLIGTPDPVQPKSQTKAKANKATEAHEASGNAEAETAPAVETDRKNTNTDLTEVAVSCEDDAVDYLIDKYGIEQSKLRTLNQIQKTAKSRGIIFTGI